MIIKVSESAKKRVEKFMPGGVPKMIRIYDDGGVGDHITVVFTGNYTSRTSRQHWYIGLSNAPYHPLGICHRGESDCQIDYPTYGHLGKKVGWDALSFDAQQVVIDSYVFLWNFYPSVYEGAVKDCREWRELPRENRTDLVCPYEKNSVEWHVWNNGVMNAF